MARRSDSPRRHDADAGGDPALLAAKAALREEVWTALPGPGGPVPRRPRPDPQLRRRRGRRRTPARDRGVGGGHDTQVQPGLRPVAGAAARAGGRQDRLHGRPRLAEPEPFFLLDPAHLAEPPRKAASISGASRSARRVTLDDLSPVDLVVMGCVAAGEDGARLGKGGGFADLEFALATAAGLIGPHTLVVTTVHELQVCAAGEIPLTATTFGSTSSSRPSG